MKYTSKLSTTSIGMMGIVLAGCAAGGGTKATPEPFEFSIAAVMTNGAVTNIDVTPNPAKDGLYAGGHARLEMESGDSDKDLIWRSAAPFWIMFEPLKSNNGQGGDNGQVCTNQLPNKFIEVGGSGPYELTCNVRRGGKKTFTFKYHVATTDPARPGFKLAPVIIVDR